MKSLIKFVLSMIVMVVSVYFIYDYYQKEGNTVKTSPIIGNNTEFLSTLKNDYNNNEIILYLEIPNVFGIAIPQTEDNNFYYDHDLSRANDKNGVPFLDYRNKSLSDKKLIIYGHDTNFRSFKFNSILNYQNKDFFKQNPVIYIYSNDGKRAYKIFTSFIDKEDSGYLDIKSYTNIEFYEHLLKFKDKSIYDTETIIDGDSKVLVLVTRASNDYEDIKNQVIMAIEDKDYKEDK